MLSDLHVGGPTEALYSRSPLRPQIFTVQGGAGAGGAGGAGMVANFLKEFSSNIPGIDEAMSFAELMRHVQRMEFDVTVFDTAPTGHTLRLLSLPGMMEKALNNVLALRDKFGPTLNAMRGMMGGDGSGLPSEDMIIGKLDEFKGAWRGGWQGEGKPWRSYFGVIDGMRVRSCVL